MLISSTRSNGTKSNKLDLVSASSAMIHAGVARPIVIGSSEEFWRNLQARHDLEVERDRLGARLKAEVQVFARAS